MTPRQPASKAFEVPRCQFQLRQASEEHEKSGKVSTSSQYGKGFFIGYGRLRGKPLKRLGSLEKRYNTQLKLGVNEKGRVGMVKRDVR